MAGAAPGSASADRGESRFTILRENVWAALGALFLAWIVLGFVLFVITGFATGSITAAFLVGVLGGLLAAGLIGGRLGIVQRVDAGRRRAPLWVRLVLPVPVFVVVFLLSFIALGTGIVDFVLLASAAAAVALVGTGAVVYFLGLWSDVGAKVRGSSSLSRLLTIVGVSLLVGALAFLLVLMFLEEASIGLAAFLPAVVLAAVAIAYLTGWHEDVKATLFDLHVGVRVALFLGLLVPITFYFALLIGPFLDNVALTYTISAAIALLILVPVSYWVRTWRDLWAAFTGLGEENRVLAVLPAFPMGVLLTFLIIVVSTSNFELAYVVSLPVGLALFLLLGLPFGVTQDIPKVVRDQELPARAGIFVGAFLLLTLYTYFAVALFLQDVEVSLVLGMAFAGLVVGLLVWQLDLHRGMGEEFESYGAPAEAAFLGLLALGTLALSFLLLALAIGSFRIAFLVSVLIAAGVSYLLAHGTDLIESMRETLSGLSWWGDLLVLSGVFVGAFLYGTLALGVFYDNVGVAIAFGAIVGLVSVIAIAQDLEVGDDILQTADEERNARVALMTLTFLGGFLTGLYAAAAVLQAAGTDLFGLPFFVALATGLGALLWVSKTRGWGTTLVGRVRSRRDRVKIAGALALWLIVGTITGMALQSVPFDATDLGIGDESGLPLTLTLAVGLLVWAWLPTILFRISAVERPPVKATASMGEKPKFWASLAWGLLGFLVTAALLLSLLDDPVLGLGTAIVVGYLLALVVTILRGSREAPEDEATS